MPDRATVLNRDDQEALRRRPEAAAIDAPQPTGAVPAVVAGSLRAGLGEAMARPGPLPRALTPASFMAMQRLAGNRAMVQALSRSQVSVQLAPVKTDQDEKPIEAFAPPAETSSLPGQAGAAAGAPGGGAGSNGAGAGAPGGGKPKEGGAATNGKGGAVGGSPGGPADVIPTTGGAAAGGAAAGGAAAGGAAGGARTTGAAGAVAAAAGAPARGAAAGGSAAGAASTGGAARAGASSSSGSGAGGAAGGGAAGGGGASSSAATGTPARPRKAPPPPITAAGGGSAQSPAGSPGPGGPAPVTGSAPTTGAPTGAPTTGAPTTGAPTTGAPATGAPTPSGTPTDANSAKTGIDWNQMLSDFGSPTRTVLEFGRLVPGWGLLAGLGADSIAFAQDLSSIPTSENASLATDLVIFRNIVNILNNGLGHVLYVNQLIQDGLAGSVVGAEFTPLTAAANETLSGIKVALDEIQLGTDIVVRVEALYQANHAPNSAEAEQWRQLADGYAANILGDVVNTVLDLISLASAGAANTAPIQEAKLPLTLAGAFLKNAAPNIISTINNLLGVWLGGLVTKGRQAGTGTPAAGGAGPGTAPATGPGVGPAGPASAPGGAGAPPVQRIGGSLPGADGNAGGASSLRDRALIYDTAGGLVDVEAIQARVTYDGINAVIDAFAAYAEDQIAQIDAVVGALTGGKSTFQVIRDAVKAGLDDMTRKLEMAQQLGETATSAKANAASISAACDSILSGLDSLVVPDVTLPSVELGDGVLAGAAEALANTAAEAANAAIRAAMSSVTAALDTAKDAVRAPVQEVKERADHLGEWLAILATECTEMVTSLHDQIAKFSEGLGHCTNVEEVINLIIGQVSDLTGMPRFTVQDLRNTWNSVGPYIDQFAALGPQLHDHAAALRAQAEQLETGTQGGPTLALPPGPPEEPGAGSIPGVGAAA